MSEQTATARDIDGWYRQHHDWLWQWLYRRLNCSLDAADLAHETFLKVLAGRRETAEVREPRAYLRTIAHGLVVNLWRRRDIERAYREALGGLPEPVLPSAEEQALILETLHEVDALITGLPEKVRRAFLMAQLDGLKYRTIAERLGVSERMVKKYMARAMLHCLQVEAW